MHRSRLMALLRGSSLLLNPSPPLGRKRANGAAFGGDGHCWIEVGDGRAGFAGGSFYAEPEPRIKMRRPGRPQHWGKLAFERWWLQHWF